MKKSILCLLMALAYYFIVLLLCFMSGTIVSGTTHVHAWHPQFTGMLYFAPIVSFMIGLFSSIENYKK